MYVIYNKEKGFLSENEDIVGVDFDFEINEFTVNFPTPELALENSEKGEIVLKIEYRN